MAENLTNSYCDRQKILNNYNLLQKIEHYLNLGDLFVETLTYQNSLVFTKWQLERLFDVSAITISKYAKTYRQEFELSGYIVLKGEAIKEFIAFSEPRNVEINIKHNLEVLQFRGLELFNFKALLNMAMLLQKSATARFIRHSILNISIDIIAEKNGDRTSYIDRPIEYLFSLECKRYYSVTDAFQKAVEQYVESSVSAIQDVAGKDFKIPRAIFYDEIYELIFGEKYEQYRQYIEHYTSSYECDRDRYKSESRFRNYSSVKNRLHIVLCREIKQAIANIENLLAKEIRSASQQQNKKIKFAALNVMVANLENDSRFEPLIKEARLKMATVNLLDSDPELLQNILSKRIECHFKSITETDPYSFITSKSRSLEDKLLVSETLAVFQRLKDR